VASNASDGTTPANNPTQPTTRPNSIPEGRDPSSSNLPADKSATTPSPPDPRPLIHATPNNPTPPTQTNPTPGSRSLGHDPGGHPANESANAPSATGRRPLIGITSYLERARFGVWDLDSVLLPREYTDSVVRAGGIPVLLPPTGDGHPELVARLDGLLLAGGADVDPARYRQETDPRTEGLRPDRDSFEFGLLTEALAEGLPILAVCRGMQVLNSALGGTLHQHLPGHVGHDGHRPELGVFGTCRVSIAKGSRTAAAFGTDTKVHCHHHQAVDVVADGLTVVGTADDGTVEAVEMPGDQFVIGVQWHPEQDPGDDRLVAALVREASRRAAR
jgi:putative glutamine amidotransferase